MIKLVNLQKIFRTEEVETVALSDVSLSIEEKEFVAIMGPSGCGKSTLLNVLGLLDNPTAGEYHLAGAEEATGNLDSKNGLEVIKLLIELNREGTTVVMVTHSQHDASFAHRIINLFDGEVVTQARNL